MLLARLAQRLEAAAYQHLSLSAYRRKIRFLATALQRPEGRALLHRALHSEPLAVELAQRPEEDFLATAQRELRERHRAEAMKEVYIKERLRRALSRAFRMPQRTSWLRARFTKVHSYTHAI